MASRRSSDPSGRLCATGASASIARGIVAMVVRDAGKIPNLRVVRRQLLQLFERPIDLTGIDRCAHVGQPRLHVAWRRRRLDSESEKKNSQCHGPTSGLLPSTKVTT